MYYIWRLRRERNLASGAVGARTTTSEVAQAWSRSALSAQDTLRDPEVVDALSPRPRSASESGVEERPVFATELGERVECERACFDFVFGAPASQLVDDRGRIHLRHPSASARPRPVRGIRQELEHVLDRRHETSVCDEPHSDSRAVSARYSVRDVTAERGDR